MLVMQIFAFLGIIRYISILQNTLFLLKTLSFIELNFI